MSSFVIQELRLLLNLAKENLAISRPKRFMWGMGRAKGFWESAYALHSSAVAAGLIKETEFAFPSWQCLQSWKEPTEPCPIGDTQ